MGLWPGWDYFTGTHVSAEVPCPPSAPCVDESCILQLLQYIKEQHFFGSSSIRVLFHLLCANRRFPRWLFSCWVTSFLPLLSTSPFSLLFLLQLAPPFVCTAIRFRPLAFQLCFICDQYLSHLLFPFRLHVQSLDMCTQDRLPSGLVPLVPQTALLFHSPLP